MSLRRSGMGAVHPVSVISQDFFITEEPDPWGKEGSLLPVHPPRFNADMVKNLRSGPPEGRTDIEVAIALAALAHEELLAYGTGGGESLNDAQIGIVLISLRSITARLGVSFDPPYRNFSTFRSYWTRNAGYGSWQARRDLLEDLFGPLHLELVRLEERTFDALADPISPRSEVGWPVVDEEIRELRRRFQTATSPQDYRALGTNCVGVLEALSKTVYDPARHLREGETVPPPDQSKNRIGRYVEDALVGPETKDLRGLVNKSIELAHHIKHSTTSTRREAGIAADAVILLANILKRLEQKI